MYSQNGELIYPSDSEDSAPPTNNADNRAVTPHSNQSLSPTPANQSTNSPTCGTRTDSFSPRYSPPILTNHLDNNVAVTAVSQHDNLTPAASHTSVPNHIDSLSSIPSQADSRSAHRDSLGLNMTAQPAHMNSITDQSSLAAGLPHQVYKTSPQASPTAAVRTYNNMAATQYQLGSQYGHGLPLLNQSQSRY